MRMMAGISTTWSSAKTRPSPLIRFYDSVDDPQRWTNWIASSWITVGSSAQDLPGFSWRCLTGDGTVSGSNYFSGGLSASLTLAGTLDLSQASVPSSRSGGARGNNGITPSPRKVSPDGGRNWNTVWIVNTLDAGASPWQQAQVVLTNTAGLSQVGLRFVAATPATRRSNSTSRWTKCSWASAMADHPDRQLAALRHGRQRLQCPRARHERHPALHLVGRIQYAPTQLAAQSGQRCPERHAGQRGHLHLLDSRGRTAASHFNQKSVHPRGAERPAPLATQNSQPFVSPGTNVVFCQLTKPDRQPIARVGLVPNAPRWLDRDQRQRRRLAFIGTGRKHHAARALTNNPLNLNYTVRIPPANRKAASLPAR